MPRTLCLRPGRLRSTQKDTCDTSDRIWIHLDDVVGNVYQTLIVSIQFFASLSIHCPALSYISPTSSIVKSDGWRYGSLQGHSTNCSTLAIQARFQNDGLWGSFTTLIFVRLIGCESCHDCQNFCNSSRLHTVSLFLTEPSILLRFLLGLTN